MEGETMQTVRRKSAGTHFSMCVQPSFIIGTCNEDGSHNFAPITWVSVTNERDDDYLLVISMFGTKQTKQNVLRTGKLSVNLVSTDMLELMDYFGTHHARNGKKDGMAYAVGRGEVVVNYFTYYAHNSRLLVKVGDRVVKGEAIALSGNTGRSTGPHCHFEVRKNGVQVNPFLYMARP